MVLAERVAHKEKSTARAQHDRALLAGRTGGKAGGRAPPPPPRGKTCALARGGRAPTRVPAPRGAGAPPAADGSSRSPPKAPPPAARAQPARRHPARPSGGHTCELPSLRGSL